MQKHTSEVNIAHRGPFFSTRVPMIAAESPNITTPSWNGSALSDPLRPRSFSSGALNTLHA